MYQNNNKQQTNLIVAGVVAIKWLMNKSNNKQTNLIVAGVVAI